MTTNINQTDNKSANKARQNNGLDEFNAKILEVQARGGNGAKGAEDKVAAEGCQAPAKETKPVAEKSAKKD